MKSLAELGQTERGFRAAEFASLARHLARARGKFSEAAMMAKSARAPARVVEVLERAAVAGGGGSIWGSELADFRLMASAFQDTFRHSSIFYRMLDDGAFVRVPFKVIIGQILTAAGAGVVEPGAAIAAQKMNAAQVGQLDRLKVGALVVLTEQLVNQATGAEALISRSLRASTSEAADALFLSQVPAAVQNSTGEPLADLRMLLNAIGLTDESRPYWSASPDISIRLATVGDTPVGSPGVPGGRRLFPDATPTGGSVLGYPMVVSSAVASGRLVLIDGARIAAASDPIELDATQQGSIQMDSEPDMNVLEGVGSPTAPVPAQMVSMWQSNSVGIKTAAYLDAAVLSGAPVQALEQISW